MGNGLNPSENIQSRRDFTDFVTEVGRNDSQNLRSRFQLRTDESRSSFTIVLDDTEGAESPVSYIREGLQPGEDVPLVVGETGEEMPYTPDEGVNLITVRVTTSMTVPVKLKSYFNGVLRATIWIPGGGYSYDQIAGLAELAELVDELDGTNEIEWRVENVSSAPAEGSISIGALEREVE